MSVFKLNSKVMQIVVDSNNEILLKYDTGVAINYVKGNRPVSLNLTEDLKSKMFSSNVSLKRKIDGVQGLFLNKENKPEIHRESMFTQRKISNYTIRQENALQEKSTKGFSSEIDLD